MEQIVKTVISAAGAFAATNLDDIFVLMLLFSQTNKSFTHTHVVIGQYVGIGVLTAIGSIGAFGALVIPQQYVGLLGLIPLYIGLKQWIENRKGPMADCKDESRDYGDKNLGHGSNIIKVAAITIANGGDNIGVYIPFFASQGIRQLFIVVLIFMILTGVWCFGGIKLAKHPKVAAALERRGQEITPILFILLGLYILLESGIFKMFHFGV